MAPKVTEVFFSPGGSGERISGLFCGFAGWEGAEKLDLLRLRDFKGASFQPGEVAVVTAPVFFGRIPEIVARKLRDVKGDGTPAIAMVVYGNRDYEDALIELADLLTANGFVLYGAGAFVARHSIYPTIAKERPDEEDKKILRAFALQCAEFLVVLGTTGESPTVKAAEREEIIKFALKTAAGRVPVVIGAATNDTASTV
jgi:hypothetical protein